VLGINRSTVDEHVSRARRAAAKRGHSPEHGMTQLVPDGYHVKGVSTLFVDGAIRAQWVKSQKDNEEKLQEFESVIRERLANMRPLKQRAWKAPKILSSDLLPAYVISDAHVGMYAWKEESGDDWDLPIARKMITGAVEWLVDKAPATDECLIINLGDYFHSDNLENRTTRGGHALDVDTRWPKVVDVGVDALVRCIDFALSKHKVVNVIIMPGNHDPHAGIMLNIAMQKAFQNNPRVVFDKSPAVYRYFRFGNTLLGTTHGDRRVSDKELPLIMANDRPQDWGASKYRHWYIGHVHHRVVDEPTGSNCTVEKFRIMAGRDAHHAGEGYRAGRDMQAIIHHREYGEGSRIMVNPDMLR
jgi:hypothetical protein